MSNFLSKIHGNEVIVFDGGMGTMLQERGMPTGVTPEAFGLEQPHVITDVHKLYVDAGADVITTNTFGGTRFKLESDVDVVAFNKQMAEVARAAAGDKAFVAGGVGPTGYFAEPLGELKFTDLVDAFKEQITGLVQGGVDLILGETHFDISEAKAVVIAAREVCSLPVGISMTFEDGKSLTGTSPATFVDVMQNMGVDIIASNCSAGPEQFVANLEEMLPRLETPLLLYPNAGLPELEDGKTVFRLAPEPFAEQTGKLAEMGAAMLGGCCGTSPAHIKALAQRTRGMVRKELAPLESDYLVLTSRSESTLVSPERPSVLIGERINPTGKKQLTAELQAGQYAQALVYAKEQLQKGARVLDVNVGAPMVEEAEILPELLKLLGSRFNVPLCLDSANPDAIEQGLNVCPGTPLVNSISGEKGRMEQLGPLCKLHGSPFILLPLEGKNLPVTAQDRIRIIEGLLSQAELLGIPKRLIMVDVLALTVSSKAEAAKHCLETIRYCRDVLKLPTVYGLSNISFGLPARELLNSSFMTMSMAAGLSACIANPDSTRLQEAMATAEVLLNRDPQAEKFINGYADWKPGIGGGTSTHGSGGVKAKAQDLKEAVVIGDKDAVVSLIDAALAHNANPFELVNSLLIPGITEVGEKYEQKEYFLPQLILSAETMQIAFERLKPLLKKDEQDEKLPVVVMATVEGDIHDIGKNIVNLMLRNHGFTVIDLGKDVDAQTIVDTAEKECASLIGLSALMTTTMVKMEETIEMVRERGLNAKVMIGGAVVTEAFAQAIKADGHATDAVSAVRLAKELVQGNPE